MTQAYPFLSLVIPTYDRPQRLTRCLNSLTQLIYPRDQFEVIVVDDGSPQSLDEVVSPFKDQLQITLISQGNAGPASARNRGAAQAKGQLVVFTDDDCQPAPDWLDQFAGQFIANPQAMIGGRTINGLPENIYSTASQLLVDYLYSYYNLDFNVTYFFTSNNLAVPLHRFRQLGQFDTSFPLAAGEDRELCDRWHYHDEPALYVPSALIYHFHQLTLRKFWRQHFNYGRGARHFHRIRAERQHQSIQVEPLTFYLNLLRYPFSQPCDHPRILLSLLFLLSQIANVSGFLWERTRPQLSHRSNHSNSAGIASSGEV